MCKRRRRSSRRKRCVGAAAETSTTPKNLSLHRNGDAFLALCRRRRNPRRRNESAATLQRSWARIARKKPHPLGDNVVPRPAVLALAPIRAKVGQRVPQRLEEEVGPLRRAFRPCTLGPRLQRLLPGNTPRVWRLARPRVGHASAPRHRTVYPLRPSHPPHKGCCLALAATLSGSIRSISPAWHLSIAWEPPPIGRRGPSLRRAAHCRTQRPVVPQKQPLEEEKNEEVEVEGR